MQCSLISFLAQAKQSQLTGTVAKKTHQHDGYCPAMYKWAFYLYTSLLW